MTRLARLATAIERLLASRPRVVASAGSAAGGRLGDAGPGASRGRGAGASTGGGRDVPARVGRGRSARPLGGGRRGRPT